jgi:hypothetical protein
MKKGKLQLLADTEDSVRQFTAELRRETETEYRHMIGAAVVLYSALSPHGRRRAGLVCSGFVLAGLRARVASKYAVRTYAIFMKEHAELLAEARNSHASRPTSGAMKFGGK